jgi:hypothetical protein
MMHFPVDVMRIIYEFDSTYRDTMVDVIRDINDGIGAAVLGIDGSEDSHYQRTVLLGITYYQWNSIRLRYLDSIIEDI